MNEAVTMIIDQGRRLLDRIATPERLKAALDHPGDADNDLWAGITELGWPAASAPESVGGFALGWTCLAEMEQLLGARTASVPLAAGTIAAAMLAAIDADTATDVASGARRAALALPGPGQHCGLRVAKGNLQGITIPTAFAAFADALLAAVDEGDGAVALWSLDASAPGVTREVIGAIDNSRGVARLHVYNTAAIRIGGAEAVEQALAAAAVAAAFAQIGGADTCLAIACDYARERKAFGQPIGAFQGIKHRLADIYAAIEVARGCAIEALLVLEAGERPAPALVAAARLGATAAYERASRETIQTFGGIGVTWEAEPHHHYRRSRALAVELGSSLLWREHLVDAFVADVEGVAA